MKKIWIVISFTLFTILLGISSHLYLKGSSFSQKQNVTVQNPLIEGITIEESSPTSALTPTPLLKIKAPLPTQQPTTQQTNQTITNINFEVSAIPTYPPCTIYYPALNKTTTYTYMSPEECQKQKDYINNLSNQQTLTPIPTQGRTQADIQACKDAVSEKYQNLIRGCYVKYQDSAADACARGYQGESGNESKDCEY